MLTIHYSNRLERLADALALRLRQRPGPVLTPWPVLVPGAGYAAWLRLALAERLGIAAGLEFCDPAVWMRRRLADALPEGAACLPPEPERLRWRLYVLLHDAQPADSPLGQYLAGGDALRRWQLGAQLAALFERYRLFRPDWLTAWRAGRLLDLSVHERWQAALWRALDAAGAAKSGETDAGPGSGSGAAEQAFFAALNGGDAMASAALPAGVDVFALHDLAPLQFDFFAALAQHAEVHWYALSPCREYWGDIVSERTRTRRAGQAYLETGNSLLAGWGGAGQYLLDRLAECEGPIFEDYAEPGSAAPGDSLLARMQRDVLNLRAPDPAETPAETPDSAAAAGGSVQFAVCHSPVRELEALHDWLLRAFDRDPTLRPDQVLVLLAQPERYAPLVAAVFGAALPAVPFSVSAHSYAASSYVGAFFALLDWPGSRGEAERFASLLEQPCIAARFGLDADGAAAVREALARAGARWGRDDGHLAALGLPADGSHTLRRALDRLLLGYAMTADCMPLLGIAPVAVEPDAPAQWLAALCAFHKALTRMQALLARPQTPAVWAGLLHDIAAEFLDERATEAGTHNPGIKTGLNAAAAAALRGALDDLMTGPAAEICAEAVPLAVIRGILQQTLHARAPSARPTGGVLFAPLASHAGLPARRICVLGLSDGAWPRPSVRPGFDLMATQPRRGDMQPRLADRWQMLLALLGARECFYASYVGRDGRTESEYPPAVALNEWMEYLQTYAPVDRMPTLSARCSIVHPMMAYNPDCFTGSGGLASCNQDMARAARALAGPRRTRAPFFTAPLDAETEITVDFAALQAFFAHPARDLLRGRLGLRLPQDSGPLPDAEPFALDRRATNELLHRLVLHRLRGEPAERAAARIGAMVECPQGAAGEHAIRPLQAAADGLLRRRGQFVHAQDAERRSEFTLELAPVPLHGVLDGLYSCGRVQWQARTIQPRDRLNLWLAHLVLQRVRPPDVALRSVLLAPDEGMQLDPVPDAAGLLTTLLALRAQGRCSPLPFFPETSYAYAAACNARKKENSRSPQDAAAAAWQKDQGYCEAADPWNALAFRDIEPLDARFEESALAVFGPLWTTQGAG